MSLQELPHPCQLCEWVSCHTLVSQQLPGGEGFVYLLLHECMEEDLILCLHISVICPDELFVSGNGCCTSCQKWVVMYGRNIWIVNKNMSAKSGRNMLTIAAPSKSMTCTTGLEELSCTGTRSSKQPPRSESTWRSSDAATSRVLLYNVTRHWVWYLASYAIMSLERSFARRAVREHTVWLEHQHERSMYCVKTFQPEDTRQKKHISMEEVAFSIDRR